VDKWQFGFVTIVTHEDMKLGKGAKTGSNSFTDGVMFPQEERNRRARDNAFNTIEYIDQLAIRMHGFGPSSFANLTCPLPKSYSNQPQLEASERRIW